MRIKFICTDHFISREVFVVEQCEECGFVFTQDYPEEASIGKYYESEDYISHSNTSRGIINKLYQFSRNLMLRKKSGFIANITGLHSGNLLDIGSGTGYFADFMKRKGWKVDGIEISRNARDFSRKQFGLNVFDPSEIGKLEPASYDCITLWHVLEHFQDPEKYMQDIKKLLKPYGFCIIALPNSDSFDAEKYMEFWAAWDVPRHLWHFSPSTFRRFAEKSGFELIKIKRLPLDVFYISAMSGKYKGAKMYFIKGMLTGFWYLLRSSFNILKSSSLIYVLQQKTGRT
jgi:SAM-dependent methyltransferase